MFMVPGVDEVLRVKGTAEITTREALRERCRERGRLPKIVIKVWVCAVFLQCAKALLRARLWSPEVQVSRTELPTMSQMLRDHTGLAGKEETQAQMVERYEQGFYEVP